MGVWRRLESCKAATVPRGKDPRRCANVSPIIDTKQLRLMIRSRDTRRLMSESASRPTAAILTLGCKLNIADSEAIARRLRRAGWRVTDRASPAADAVIV